MERKPFVADDQESSHYPCMELNYYRFLRSIYEILQESEVDPTVLDDPFKRSVVLES